jgi:hypothetical protein
LDAYFFLELPGELDIAQVHEILLGDVGVEVFLVVGEGVEGVVVELVLVLIVVHISYIFIDHSKSMPILHDQQEPF